MDHAVESHWGSEPVDPSAHTLPALKVQFLLSKSPQSGSLLEIGSGDGKILRTLARHRPSLELFGCDVREPGTPPDVYSFRLMEDGVPADDGSFDVVLLVDSLEHVPDPDRTLSEAARVLKPEGRLLGFVPIEGETLSAYEVYRRLLGSDTYAVTKEHIQAFTHRGLTELIDRRFQIDECRYAYHVLGQVMDASFFAALRLQWLRRFWWSDNSFYNRPRGDRKLISSVMNWALQAANAVAWAESAILSRTSWGAAGVLVEAHRRV